jgi:Predicted xylanase/chitin deacetylase
MKIKSISRRVGHVAERLAGSRCPVIVLYHHVAEVTDDPWNIAVAPRRFERQIAMLRWAFEIVPLNELRAPPGKGKPRAAITFDDGYRDVVTTALPILERFDCPATVFLTTGSIGSRREFWWDELTRIIMSSDTTSEVRFSVRGREVRFALPRSRSARHQTLEDVWALLSSVGDSERSDILEALASQTKTDLTQRPTHAIMSADDVAGLRGSLLSVGAHTVTHPSLPELDAETQWREIAQSRRDCAELTGEAPRAFAYPHGHVNEASAAAVRRAGFDFGVTCELDFVRPDDDDVLLPRLPTFDCGGIELLLKLS